MSILTLTPSRFTESTDFEEGSYAYAVADRPVRYLGDYITPTPLAVEVDNDGDLITFDLVANSLIDEAEFFHYSISLFDQNGQNVWHYDIIMPDTDSDIFDLVPVTQDLDSCVTTTLDDNTL